MNALQLHKNVFRLSHSSGAYTVLDYLFFVHLGALENHDVLLSCCWLLCLTTTIQRTSSRLFRCVTIACAPMRFPAAICICWSTHCPMTVWVCQWKPFWIPVDDSFKKAYVEDWVFQITDTSDLNLPYEQDDLIPETPRVPLPVPSSYREAPKPEVSAQEHNEPPLPPLPSRPRCECLELPFSHDDILSGFENLRLPQF